MIDHDRLPYSPHRFCFRDAVRGADARLRDRAHPARRPGANYPRRPGVEQPSALQYASFLSNALRGDWGISMVTGRPVLAEVLNVLPWTIELTLVSLALGIALGVPLGVWA